MISFFDKHHIYFTDNVHTHEVPGSYIIVPILSSTADDNGKLGDMVSACMW